jgi:hypothetical protein
MLVIVAEKYPSVTIPVAIGIVPSVKATKERIGTS